MFSALSWPIETRQPRSGQESLVVAPPAHGRARQIHAALQRLRRRLAAALAGKHLSPDRNALCLPAAAQPPARAGK